MVDAIEDAIEQVRKQMFDVFILLRNEIAKLAEQNGKNREYVKTMQILINDERSRLAYLEYQTQEAVVLAVIDNPNADAELLHKIIETSSYPDAVKRAKRRLSKMQKEEL
jgi:hypothetical protein